MQKWEYRYISLSPYDDDYEISANGKFVSKINKEDFYDYLNKLGAEGWELVNSEVYRYWFKRPVE